MTLDAEDKEWITLVVDRAALAAVRTLDDRFEGIERRLDALDGKVDLLLSVHPQLKSHVKKSGPLTWGRGKRGTA